MPTYTIYYWVQQGDKGRSIAEPLEADSLEAATKYVQDKVKLPSFYFDSVDHGRVVIVSSHVQYAEIEEGGAISNHINDFPG